MFEGIRYNYVKKIKKFQKEGISIGFINTEFLVGEENMELKYFTHDNFFLLNRYINKKSNKFLLRFIFIFYKFKQEAVQDQAFRSLRLPVQNRGV